MIARRSQTSQCWWALLGSAVCLEYGTDGESKSKPILVLFP